MKKYILLAAVAFALTACETEDEHIDEPVAVQISATIGESVVSRAADASWAKNDNIGVTMNGLYTNLKYTTENGDGKFAGNAMYFRNKEDLVTVTAYYPFTGTEDTSPETITVSTTAERQNPAEQQKYDFLYAKKENVSGAQPNVDLAFSHMMSKVTLTFKNGNAGTDVRKITSCVISGLVLDGTFNPVTGECAAKTGAPATDLTLTPTVENEKTLPSLIFFPQTVGKVTLKITDSEKQNYSCELNFDENRLKSGNNYSYTVTVKKTALSATYSITNWVTKTSGSEASSDDSGD